MIKAIASRLYASYELICAVFLAAIIAMTLTVSTGFGQGSVIARTVPVADTAVNSVIAETRQQLLSEGQTEQTTAILVEGVDLSNEAAFDAASQKFTAARADIEKSLKVTTGENFLDPFTLGFPKANEELANPLLSSNRKAFVALLFAPSTDTPAKQAEFQARISENLPRIEQEIEKAYPNSTVSVSSPAFAQEQAQNNASKGTLIIILVTLLASLIAFYVATGKATRAFASFSSILGSQLAALTITWLLSFFITIPTSLVPLVALATTVLSGISSAVFNAVDAYSLEYRENIELAGDHGPRTRRRARIEYLAQRMKDKRNLIITAIGITFASILILFAASLNHLVKLAIILLPTVIAVWAIELIATPSVLLLAERFSQRWNHSKVTLPETSPIVRAQNWLRQRLALPYAQTPFSKNQAAPGIAALLLILASLPCIVISPRAMSAAELMDASQTVHFQQTARQAFPQMVDPDFVVIAQTSPTNLQKWADSINSKSQLVVAKNEATTLGERFATVSFNFRQPDPTFKEMRTALAQVSTPAQGFEHGVYSDTARNIEAVDSGVSNVPLAITLTVILSLGCLFLLSGNIWWSIIQTIMGGLTVTASVGLAAGAFKLGLFKILPGTLVENRVDLGGLYLGGVLAIMITAVTLLEPLSNRRPTATRATWLISGLTALAAIFSGFIQLATTGAIMLASVAMGMLISVLVNPQLLELRNQQDSKLQGKHPRIQKLHDRLHQALEKGPRLKDVKKTNKSDWEPADQTDVEPQTAEAKTDEVSEAETAELASSTPNTADPEDTEQ
ncbi:hypothetical protein BSR28_04055 [Boudabousia liubingyangii]|uniref:hypothetical protein n=1 Tax=Boudabousia liubingyangii TaxID=1921764 RepID=UPI00093B7742|nr:hypothetical protein [Boudabousia liubingyangii]OKL47670.1 hypothetical protein BSR28_04055 [Boudabousia liubingyangii]